MALLTALCFRDRRKRRLEATDVADKEAAVVGGPLTTAAAGAPPQRSISAVSPSPGASAPPAYTADAGSPDSKEDGQKSAKSELDTFIDIPRAAGSVDVHTSPLAGPGAAPELDTFISPPTTAADTFITPTQAAVDTFLPASAQQAPPEASWAAPRDLVSALPSDYNTWR